MITHPEAAGGDLIRPLHYSLSPDERASCVLGSWHRSRYFSLDKQDHSDCIRQLCKLLRTAAAMVDEEGVVRREHLPDDVDLDAPRPAGSSVAASIGEGGLDAPELGTIRRVLEVDGDVPEASRRLGIGRNTIHCKLRAPT